MTGPVVWEHRLWGSDKPLPNRRITADHPIYGLPKQYIADDQVLIPWSLFGLVDPVPAEWAPLPEHHEAAYLTPSGGGLVRIGLINYAEGVVVAWAYTAASRAYQQRRPAARDADEPAPDPISRPRRSRAGRRGPGPP